MADNRDAITARQLTKRYGRTAALDGLDLLVRAGTVCGLIGPNGAGKTTLMRVLLDLARPTSGSVSVFGIHPSEGGTELRRKIGFVPGEVLLARHGTGEQVLTALTRLSGPVPAHAIRDLAERFDVDLTRRARALSKGNRQKLALIQAFAAAPPLLILDEPTSGLDPLAQREFAALVREHRARGATIFLSSHVLSEVQHVADDVAVLRSGRLIVQSTVDALRARARRRFAVGVRTSEAATLIGRLRSRGAVTVVSADGTHRTHEMTTVTGSIEGEVGAFLQAISPLEVLDLAVAEPDLEDVVLSIYTESRGAAQP